LDEAIEYCKQTLAPFALEAFPEAYTEFKRTLLLLVYKDSQILVPNEWNQELLQELVDKICISLWMTVGSCGPLLQYILIYLIKVHSSYNGLVHYNSSISGEFGKLVDTSHKKEKPFLLQGSQHFDEGHIQTLAQVIIS